MIETMIQTELKINISLNVRDSKELYNDLIQVLKENKDLKNIKKLANAIDNALDERQLY